MRREPLEEGGRRGGEVRLNFTLILRSIPGSKSGVEPYRQTLCLDESRWVLGNEATGCRAELGSSQERPHLETADVEERQKHALPNVVVG